MYHTTNISEDHTIDFYWNKQKRRPTIHWVCLNKQPLENIIPCQVNFKLRHYKRKRSTDKYQTDPQPC